MKTIKLDIVLLIGIIYLLWDIFLKKKESDEIKQSEIDKELEKEKLSYPKSQYYSFADSLETSMQNAGTDEEGIYSVFRKLNNDSDYLMLQKAFGNRTYSGELFGGLTSLVDPTEDSLEQWLKNELNSDEIKKINTILTLRGIKYRL